MFIGLLKSLSNWKLHFHKIKPEKCTIKGDFPDQVSQTALAKLQPKFMSHEKLLHTFRTKGRSVTFSIQQTPQPPNTTSTNPEAHIHRQDR